MVLKMKTYIFAFVSLAGCFHLSTQITVVHHDKPEASSIHITSPMVRKETLENVTLSTSERQKRLLPYVNFYHANSNNPVYYEKYVPTAPKKVYDSYDEYHTNPDVFYQVKNTFTPFSENNAIPGPFRPMVTSSLPQEVKVQYVPFPQNNVPDFSEIYDKFAQLKLSQNYKRPTYVQIKRPLSQQTYPIKPQIYHRQKVIQPSRTTIETFTATNIDIPSGPADDEYNTLTNYPRSKPYITPYSQESYNRKPHLENRKPFIIVSATHQEDNSKPIIYVQRKPVLTRKPVVYDTSGYEPFPKYTDQSQYDDSFYTSTSTPTYTEFSNYTPAPKNTLNLPEILKYLQATNTLPKTLTPDNIDNSIKTLMKILNALKKQQKLSKPAVVQEVAVPTYIEEIENEAGVGISGQSQELPGTANELYPEDTEEGGTPGKPGVDYPALSSIPQTSFNCKTQRYKGFFGDPDTNCQVWHYCDLNGGQASFLCPNGTIFSQVALTCDWWYNVKCSSTAQLYVLNERLYKYIIPLSPKFPEDYNGPLVDKYLALKFQEMEDKMRKEKKGKGDATKDDSEEADDIETEKREKMIKVEDTKAKSIQKETLETVEEDSKN